MGWEGQEGDVACGRPLWRMPLVEIRRKLEEGARTTLIVPSHELEQNVSFATRFQCTEKTSLLCSFQLRIGNSSSPISKSLIEPSPVATTHWFPCSSDQARSYSESWVSNLSPFVSYMLREVDWFGGLTIFRQLCHWALGLECRVSHCPQDRSVGTLLLLSWNRSMGSI